MPSNMVWLFLLLWCPRTVSAIYVNPGLPRDDYYSPGDVLLGVLSPLHEVIPNEVCALGEVRNYMVQSVQAMVYMSRVINDDPQILPNISLGFVVLNDCNRESVAVARSTKLIRPKANDSKCLLAGSRSDDRSFYNVAGSIGPTSSAMSVPVSSLLSLYSVPHISWSASSKELSDKARFEYFSRVIPPDQYQAEVMVSILRYFNWTYISTLHSEGSYGANGMSGVHRLTKKYDICVAYSRELKLDETSDEDLDDIIVQFRRHKKAKVVVLFIGSYHVVAFLSAVARMGAGGEFIFIGSDGYIPSKSLFGQALNSFAVNWNIEGSSQGYEMYYKNLNPVWNATGDQWIGEYLPEELGCRSNVSADVPDSCAAMFKTMTDVPGFSLSDRYTLMMDATKTMSLGLHNLIMDRCPGAVRDKAILDSCITGPTFLQYIRKVRFQGISGFIEFDGKGDSLGNYKIIHFRKAADGSYEQVKIGLWERRTERLTLAEDSIQWHTYNDGTLTMSDGEIPESVCAKPCQAGEFYIQGELKCCWECRLCRSNERVRDDAHGCTTCPENTWPEQVNYTSCVTIDPTYMKWLDPIALGLLALDAAGLITTLAIAVIFIKCKDRKVVKGSNRELVIPMIIGLFLAYLTVITYIVKPVVWACYIAYFGFHVSCTLIFGPLFLKCSRLYRIFDAAEKCKTRVRGVSSLHQVFFITVIFFIQVGVTTAIAILFPPNALTRMPVPTEKYVELLCDLPLYNLLGPLSYNLLLLLLCAIFGFLTRKLPDNFNESWYIFISVTTTLFVWIAFLPTYFTAFYAYHKAALLALALILNSVVTSLCLFGPKIYALYYVDESKIKVTNFEFEETETTSKPSTINTA